MKIPKSEDRTTGDSGIQQPEVIADAVEYLIKTPYHVQASKPNELCSITV